jgi:hypothetical protein
MAVSKTAKGNKGESCTEAIRSSIKPGEILTATVLFDRIKELGKWSADTIWQHLIAHLANLAPARHHYSGFQPFLFLHEDGRYELFDPSIHPKLAEKAEVEKPARKEQKKTSLNQLSLELRKRRKKQNLIKEEAKDYSEDK